MEGHHGIYLKTINEGKGIWEFCERSPDQKHCYHNSKYAGYPQKCCHCWASEYTKR